MDEEIDEEEGKLGESIERSRQRSVRTSIRSEVRRRKAVERIRYKLNWEYQDPEGRLRESPVLVRLILSSQAVVKSLALCTAVRCKPGRRQAAGLLPAGGRLLGC